MSKPCPHPNQYMPTESWQQAPGCFCVAFHVKSRSLWSQFPNCTKYIKVKISPNTIFLPISSFLYTKIVFCFCCQNQLGVCYIEPTHRHFFLKKILANVQTLQTLGSFNLAELTKTQYQKNHPRKIYFQYTQHHLHTKQWWLPVSKWHLGSFPDAHSHQESSPCCQY